MNTTERIEMLESMEFIMRHLNDERLITAWLESGLPDGLAVEDYPEYIDDLTFADIMDTFVYIMGIACKDPKLPSSRRATLYCDKVLSEMSF